MRLRSAIMLFLIAASLTLFASAQSNTPPPQPAGAKTAASVVSGDYVGSDVCIGCHEDQSRRMKNTVMGKVFAHPRTANEKLNCESCHGPGKAHVDAGGGKETVAIRFGKDSKNTIEEQNEACLSCHTRGNRMFWKGSQHEARMSCVDCHQVKKQMEARLSSETRFNAPLTDVKSITKQQPELCLQCHQMKRAQLQRSSHMPYREGKVTCTSCHNPHGSPNPKQLIQASLNENCYSCHAERRGPFAFEHPVVMENCASCHDPHGSNNPQLLKARQPRVCNECHVTNRHPTQPQNVNVKVFNRGCTNCHSTLHGSNHPSGSMFLR
jgi:DmsE family decaheme c-type cytochrome